MFAVYLIKVVWEFEVGMLAFALIKCCWVAKSKRKLFYENIYYTYQGPILQNF